ncbi:ABC transporter permease [Clostridium sp. FP1]|uniref:ABC transporter permease n=1 Tax=Clostridium sp. FP1 TaxID=2724076 RepID=UPI0013E99954|nr:ABC transporter permease [Clostridium sp. FP1]MBZ9633992.1 ABC transporter permease [Clostridium sp. FP1]
MLVRLIINDIYKQRRSMLIFMVIAIPIFTSVLLAIDFGIRYESYLYPLALKKGITSWSMLLLEQKMVFFKEYLPLFGAIIISSLFDSEYKNNGWTLSLTYPIARGKIVISKFVASLIFMSIMLIINSLSLIVVGKIIGFPEAINSMYFVKMFFIQFISVAGVMTIHLYITIKNKNVLKSIGVAAIITIVSSDLFYRGISISKYNPYCFASFSDGLTKANLSLQIIMSAVLIFIGLFSAVIYFNKKQSY